jgi:hypothetical protein
VSDVRIQIPFPYKLARFVHEMYPLPGHSVALVAWKLKKQGQPVLRVDFKKGCVVTHEITDEPDPLEQVMAYFRQQGA